MTKTETTKVNVIRHGPSQYNNYLAIELDGDPTKYVDYMAQVPDLDQTQIGFVRERMARIAERVDPANERVVLLTSREMRAYQTAGELVKALEERGVEIASPRQEEPYPVRINDILYPEYVERGGIITLDRRIVPVDFASLFYRAMWIQDMFEPREGSAQTTFVGLNEDLIPEEARRDYRLAREIIRATADQDAGWGDNWARFYDQEPFCRYTPSVRDNTDRMLGGIEAIRDGRYAPERTSPKATRYVLMTHEENVIGVTKDFGTSRFRNCDEVELEVPKDPRINMVGKYNGQTRDLAHLVIRHLGRQ